MLIHCNDKPVQAPDFLLIGAAKSGTTTVFRHLDQHPSIYFPPSQKEPFYHSFGGTKPQYTDEDFTRQITWKTEDYLGLYRDAPSGSLIGDGSTSYLYTPDQTLASIRALYGSRTSSLKVFCMLRNPVDRAYSHYMFLVRNGHENLPFEQAILPETIATRKKRRWGFDYLEYGNYYEQIVKFRAAFPHMKVWLMEDLKNPQQLMNEIYEFLGVPAQPIIASTEANPSGRPKSAFLVNQLRKNSFLKKMVNLLPKSFKAKSLELRDSAMKKLMVKEELDSDTRLKLIRFYAPDIERLQNLIGRDLTNWLKA